MLTEICASRRDGYAHCCSPPTSDVTGSNASARTLVMAQFLREMLARLAAGATAFSI